MFGLRQHANAETRDCFKRNQKKRKIEKLINNDQVWIRSVRVRETQLSNHGVEAEHVTEGQATIGESPYHLSSIRYSQTDRFRNLLINNEARDAPVVISEEIYRENLRDLLNGIDECAGNPAEWSRERTNFYFDKIQRFLDSWQRQLTKEKEKFDWEVMLVKGKFEKQHDSIANRLRMLTGVFQEAIDFMNFSEFQQQSMRTKIHELNDVRDWFGERGQVFLSESSLATELKIKDEELIKARKQADECCKELRKMQNSLKEANMKLNNYVFYINNLEEQNMKLNNSLLDKEKQQVEDIRKMQNRIKDAHSKLNHNLLYTNDLVKQQAQLEKSLKEKVKQQGEELKKMQKSLQEANLKLKNNLLHTNKLVEQQVRHENTLQDKEKELDELKKQLESAAQKQRETESELSDTKNLLQSFVAESREMSQTQQKEMNQKLSEIQTMLLLKVPDYKPNQLIENEGLSEEEKIFQDIKALIENSIQASKSNKTCENSVESALKPNSDSAILKVTEYEIHLVTLVAIFLKMIPYSVSTHYILLFMKNIDYTVDLQFVENLLRKFPSFFKEVVASAGSAEKNWIYLDLKPVITTI